MPMLRAILCFTLSSFTALALAGQVEIVATGYLPWDIRTTVSNDGRYVAYETEDAVLLRDRIAGTTVQVSDSGSKVLISADGSTVAFTGNTGGLFLFERATGTTQLVSHASDGSYDLSGDGRWLAFTTGEMPQVYLFDRLTRQNVLVAGGLRPKISADGRFVVFESSTGEFLQGIFLYDRIADTTTEVAFSGRDARINADGRWVAFLSKHDLGLGDAFGLTDVFLWDRLTGGLTLVSRSAASPLVTGNAPSHWAPYLVGWDADLPAQSVLSADGRWVAFYSPATNLVPDHPEDDFYLNLFLFDRETGTNTRVTAKSANPGYYDAPGGYALSADGSRLAFTSNVEDMVPGQVDNYGTPDLFLYHRATGATELVSRKAGTAATAASGFVLNNPHLSADGRTLVFHSGAPDQHEDDQDDTDTVFAYVTPDPGRDFHTVVPCRLLDTRQNGPALTSGGLWRVKVTGSCGIPATARAVAVNATVVQPSAAGGVGLHPGDVASGISTIGFQAGQIRGNNAILPLAFDGTGTLAAVPAIPGGGTVHLLLDVSGWFE